MIGPHTLIVRAGVMTREHVEANIRDCVTDFGRPGICLRVVIDDEVRLDDDAFVPNKQVCVTTPTLLREAGIDPAWLDPTNDEGNRYHYTLWLPDEPADTLVEWLWDAFRGPIPKGDVSSEWSSEDLRGLHHPRP